MRPSRNKSREDHMMNSFPHYDEREFTRPPSTSYSSSKPPPPGTVIRRDRTRSRSRERRHSRERENRYSRDKYEERRHREEHKSHGRSKEDPEESYLDVYREDHSRRDSHSRHEPPAEDPSTFHLPFRTLEEERKEEAKNEDRINRLEKLVEVLVGKTAKKKSNDFHVGGSDREYASEVPEFIPRNHKFTTSMWLNAIDEFCMDKNYDERSCIKFLEDQMTGIVKAWFKTMSHFDFTWPELKMLISKTFPDNVDFTHSLRLLVNREKHADESISDYYFTKLYLCEACKITGENAVSCLIDGLTNPFMKQDIKAYNFLTPETLFSQYFAKYPEETHRTSDDRPRDVEVYEEEELPPQPQEVFNKYRGNKPVKKCFTCNKFGHLTVDCRHAPLCYNCNKRGHIAAKCHFKKQKVKLLSPNKTSNIVPCEIMGVKLTGYVDTGSGVVTIKESVARKLGMKIEECSEVLTGFGGGIVDVLGIIQTKIRVDNFKSDVSIKVVNDEVNLEDMIIGQPLLNHDEAVVVIDKNGVKMFNREKSETHMTKTGPLHGEKI